MEREFLGYAEALALKELGFDEKCFYYLKHKDKLPKLMIDTLGYFNNQNVNIYCSAPLFQQAFKWIRERYSLDAWVVPYHSLKGKKYSYIIEGSDFYLEYDTEELDFGTYEEAELACLRKLIEIAKKDDN